MAQARKYVDGREELSATEFIRMILRSPTWSMENIYGDYRMRLDVIDASGNHAKYCSPELLSMPNGVFEVFLWRIEQISSGNPNITEDILDGESEGVVVQGIVDQRELS